MDLATQDRLRRAFGYVRKKYSPDIKWRPSDLVFEVLVMAYEIEERLPSVGHKQLRTNCPGLEFLTPASVSAAEVSCKDTIFQVFRANLHDRVGRRGPLKGKSLIPRDWKVLCTLAQRVARGDRSGIRETAKTHGIRDNQIHKIQGEQCQAIADSLAEFIDVTLHPALAA